MRLFDARFTETASVESNRIESLVFSHYKITFTSIRWNPSHLLEFFPIHNIRITLYLHTQRDTDKLRCEKRMWTACDGRHNRQHSNRGLHIYIEIRSLVLLSKLYWCKYRSYSALQACLSVVWKLFLASHKCFLWDREYLYLCAMRNMLVPRYSRQRMIVSQLITILHDNICARGK